MSPRPKAPGRGDLVFLDTGLHLPTAAPPPAPDQHPVVEAPPPEGLELTEAAYASDEIPVPESAAPVAGLEQTVEADMEVDAVGSVAGLELEATPDDVAFEGVPLESMDPPAPPDAEPVEGLLDSTEDLDLSLAATEVDFEAPEEPEADLDLDFDEEPAARRPPQGCRSSTRSRSPRQPTT